MQLAHRIRLYPNAKASAYLRQACGVARHAYNWALARQREKYAAGDKTVSGYDLLKEYTACKRAEFPWALEVTKWAPQMAIYNLDTAYKNFFANTAKFPEFKKKGKCTDSFYLGPDAFGVEGNRLRVSKLGYVKMAQKLRFPGKPASCTISRDACGHWYAAVLVNIDSEWQYPHVCENQAASVGIDLGFSTLATLSTGEKIESGKFLRRSQRKLRRVQKALSRTQKGSKNREKVRVKVARANARVRNQRQDQLHKLSARIVRDFGIIGIEDLSVRGMQRGLFGKSVADAGFREFRRQLEYKSKLSGSKLVIADRLFPSSKTCSDCGCVRTRLGLGEREWGCVDCGANHDRDVNAAINLMKVAVRYTETENACGEDVRPKRTRFPRKAVSLKQESGLGTNPHGFVHSMECL